MPRPPLRLTCTALFHAVAGFGITMDYGLLNPMMTYLKDFTNRSIQSNFDIDVSPTTIEWLTGFHGVTFMLGGMIASATIKYPADRLGRRNTLMILKNIIATGAAVCHVLSKPLNSVELLLLGHFLSGAAVAQAECMVPVFLSECSPVYCRGLICSMSVCIGIGYTYLLSAILGTFCTENNWHYLFLCQLPFSWIHLGATPLFAEPVKHLQATQNECKLNNDSASFYMEDNHIPKLTAETQMDSQLTVEKSVDLRLAFSTTHLRWPMVLCCLVLCSLPLSGYDSASLYSTSTLLALGVPQHSAVLYSVLFIQLPGFLVSVVGLSLLENVGRRPLLLTGFGLFSVGSFCWFLSSPATAYIGSELGVWVQAAGMGITVAGYKIGSGLLGFVLPGELAPQASRALTASVSHTVFAALLILTLCLFPPLYNAINSYCMLPCVIFNVGALTFIYKYFPETKGKSVAEILKRWMKEETRAVTV